MKTYTTKIHARYMSEKLDGVQGIWTGKTLVSRSGASIQAPGWWLAGLPDKEMVGELWIGRGQFETVKSIVQSNSPAGWHRVCFRVFFGADSTENLGEFADVIPQVRILDSAHLEAFYNDVITQGGEGVVLKDGNGELFKRKPIQDDDGEVIGYTAGKGRHQGMIGALVVRLRSGRELKISSGLNVNLRKHPPAIGTIVKFAYSGKTSTGLPRFARFLTVRLEEILGFESVGTFNSDLNGCAVMSR